MEYKELFKLIQQDHIRNADKVKLTFEKPVQLRVNGKRRYKTNTTFIVRTIKEYSPYTIVYTLRKNSRYCYILNESEIEYLINVEPEISKQKTEEFNSFNEFKNMFDPKFISEEEIKNLWDSTSPMHGGKFKKSDFRPLTPKGKRVVSRFLEKFEGINYVNKFYQEKTYFNKTYKILSCFENAYSNKGNARDIKVEHTAGVDKVFYSSEYYRYANGDYYLLVASNKVLYIERD